MGTAATLSRCGRGEEGPFQRDPYDQEQELLRAPAVLPEPRGAVVFLTSAAVRDLRGVEGGPPVKNTSLH